MSDVLMNGMIRGTSTLCDLIRYSQTSHNRLWAHNDVVLQEKCTLCMMILSQPNSEKEWRTSSVITSHRIVHVPRDIMWCKHEGLSLTVVWQINTGLFMDQSQATKPAQAYSIVQPSLGWQPLMQWREQNSACMVCVQHGGKQPRYTVYPAKSILGCLWIRVKLPNRLAPTLLCKNLVLVDNHLCLYVWFGSITKGTNSLRKLKAAKLKAPQYHLSYTIWFVSSFWSQVQAPRRD